MTNTRNVSYPDYYAVDIPTDKPREEYTYNERRAELLRLIIEKGDPSLIHQSRLAKEYGVVQSTIHKDIKAISKSLEQNLDKTDLKMEIETSFKKLKKEALKRDDYKLYLKTVESYRDWLFDIGNLEKSADKLDVDGSLDINFKMWDDTTDDDNKK